MGFIPDLGVSPKKDKKTSSKKKPRTGQNGTSEGRKKSGDPKKKKSKKKIVSYNLELDLVERVKSVADEKDMYYSSLVSRALRRWLAEHG